MSHNFHPTKKTTILLIVDIVLIIAIITTIIINTSKSAILSILIAPSDATVYINGNEYNTGIYKFYPGTITAKIERDGFDSKEITINLEANTLNRLFSYLEKNNDSDSNYSDYDYEILTQISNIDKDDNTLSTIIKNHTKENDLKNFLPLYYNEMENNIYLSFFYENENCKKEKYCIHIHDAINGNYNFAVSLLKKYGFEQPDYEFIYDYSCEKGDQECLIEK